MLPVKPEIVVVDHMGLLLSKHRDLNMKMEEVAGALTELAIKNNIECDLALERIMACGFGICQGCTVEKNQEISHIFSYRSKFVLACIDGPIFSAKEIVKC